MPVLSVAAKTALRTRYKRLIHNLITSVKKADTQTTVQPDPRFEGREQTTYKQWDDFHCSVFHFLSGKTDRLLQERGEHDLIAQLGLTPETTITVQYVSDDLLVVETIVSEPPRTAINNLEVNDEVLWMTEWWKVKVVIQDSEGIQHTVIACK